MLKELFSRYVATSSIRILTGAFIVVLSSNYTFAQFSSPATFGVYNRAATFGYGSQGQLPANGDEAFSDLLMQEDMSLSHMLIRMQWIALQYVAIRQCLFLLWDRDSQNGGTQNLSYDTVRETIVILTRMTGYEESDIYEYLEECFASPIWEWGYFSLICGDPR